MSRHEAPGEQPGTVVAFGWDQPLLTFFGIVYRGKRVLLWVGADRPQQLPEIEDLQRVLRGHLTLTPEHRRELYRDRDEGRM